MRVCEYEDSRSYRAKTNIFPTTEILIIVIVVAFMFGVFYLLNGEKTTIDSSKEYVVEINTKDTYQNQLNSIIKQLCPAEDNLNELDKYKLLHDFVAQAITYEFSALRPGVNLAYGQGYNDPAQALNTGKGVCGSYAQLYKDLCDRADLTCEVAQGYAFIPGNTSSLGHAWNLVKVGTQWYHLDCCWSDTGGGLYEYYMRGENFIQVGDGGNFREMYTPKITISKTDYKIDRNEQYNRIVIRRK